MNKLASKTTASVSGTRLPCRVPKYGLRTRGRTAGGRKVTQALSDTQFIMSACNAAMLSIGRFGFLPYQRRKIAESGLPEQNGEDHFSAGDNLAKDVGPAFGTKDPAGFNLIDVMAWGSLGHVLGYACLAAKNAAELGVTVVPNW